MAWDLHSVVDEFHLCDVGSLEAKSAEAVFPVTLRYLLKDVEL
jgi:hypothetical protein